MAMHINLSGDRFDHGLALYPKSWRGYLVSENKICFQFNNVQAKVRVKDRQTEDLVITKAHQYAMPIQAHGTDVEFIAVGVPLELHPTMLKELIKSYKEHIHKYNNQKFIEDLKVVYTELGNIL